MQLSNGCICFLFLAYIQSTNVIIPHLVPKITEDLANLAAYTVYQQESWSGTWQLGAFQQIHY